MTRFLVAVIALAAAGCYDARVEVLDTTGGTSGSGTITGTTGATSGVSVTATSSTSGSTTSGNPLQTLCASVETELGIIEPELQSCNVPITLSLSSTQCLAEVATCSATELQAIQTFLTCVSAAPTVNCATDPGGEFTLIGALEPCEQDLSAVTCLSLTGGTGGSAGTVTGTDMGVSASGTGTTGGAVAAGGSTGGFGSIGGTGGTATAGFGTGGLPDGGRRGIPDGGFGTGGTPFCGACTADRECGGTNACISDVTGQDVCGQDCAAGETCPTNSSCETLNDTRGRSVTQCVPSSCAEDAG